MKLIAKIIIAVAGVFIVLDGSTLYINSYRYNDVYIPEYLRLQSEAEDQLSDNKGYFETVAGAFADKYGELFTLQENEADSGEIYYIPIDDSLRIDHGENATSNVIVEENIPKQKKYTFTQEQAKAMKYILSELDYAYIRYCLLNDGRFYVYFCKDGILKKPFFAVANNTIPDDALDFGFVYSSDGKTLPIQAQQIFYTEEERILDTAWYRVYGLQ